MPKTATLSIRTDPEIKAQAEQIYQRYGITLSDAVNIFLHTSVIAGGLPFDLRRPSADTLAAMRETEELLAGRVASRRYASAQALFADLDAEPDDP